MKIGNIQYPTILQCIIQYRKTTLIILVFLSMLGPFIQQSHAQESDSLKTRKAKRTIDTAVINRHSPHKATIYSMILPGLGQAYNRKYWKIPIVYAGFGVFYYLIDYNNTEYVKWRDAYYFSLVNEDPDADPINDYYELYGDNPDFLKARKNDARRYRDLNYILAGVWYALNVIDAAVDAHLFTWDVNDDISLRVEPHMHQRFGQFKPTGGFKLSMNF